MAIDAPKWERDPHKFVCLGINLSLPVDLLPPNKYRALENTRPYGEGQIIGRPGLAPASTATVSSIHSIIALNDPFPSPVQFPGAFKPFSLFVGDGTEIRIGIPPAPGGLFSLFTIVDTGYSGKPLGFVIMRPSLAARPWLYVADSAKMASMTSNAGTGGTFQWGVSPPNDPPTAVLLGAAGSNPNGPDIGTTGVPYVYRYRGRKAGPTHSGAFGNAGPAMRNLDAAGNPIGMSAKKQNVQIFIATAHPDPAVSTLDIFRYGGSLTNWFYLGSISNFVGSTIIDNLSDDVIAGNPQLEFGNFQPFPTFDQPQQGRCTVAAQAGGGGIITITSGAQFLFYDPAALNKSYYGYGNQIIVDTQAFTMYRAPTSATTVEVVETPTAPGANQLFVLPSPQIWHQPLPFVWGPFGGGFAGTFIFACGDPNDLGSIKWTNGNDPDNASDQNRLLITSPSEPLQNGCMYAGNSWVFSSERLFAMYPTFGQASDFIAIEVPNSKGLFMRWCLCVGRKGIYFRARDGIYRTTGAPPESVTDADLFSIFPHESSTSSFVADGQAVSPNGFGGAFSPPDDTKETDQRLDYADGFVYYTYVDQASKKRTLVLNEETGGWISRDTYTPAINKIYEVQGGNEYDNSVPEHQVILCGTDGNLYQFSANTSDNGAPIAGRIRTASKDQKDPRPRKLYGDIFFDFDGACETLNLTAGFDAYTFFSVLNLSGTNLTGRHQAIVDIAGGLGQYAANIGLEIDWTTTGSRLAFYFWEPSFMPRPEVTILRATDWTDDGRPGSKFFQGMVIHGDSIGAPRSVNVQFDGGGVAQAALNFTASTQQELVYSFTPAFVSKLVRVVPTDINQWRLYKIRWIWEPAPDLASNWITQPTTHNFTEFFHHRDGYFALIAQFPVSFQVLRLDDGTTFNYTIPATLAGSLYQQKQYIVLQPMKAKIVQYTLNSQSAFRLFQRDCSIRVGPWGRSKPYTVVQPFGDVSRERGAVI
jgi:hypothetical protein